MTGWRASCSARAAPWARHSSAFQEYGARIVAPGVILAVCSKNEEANALEPFEKHPEMILKRGGQSPALSPNWSDKAAISGLLRSSSTFRTHSLVFVDDNPF